ncbi:S26 family signal peptidase [Methanosarcina baikalica]|uniref:S26 family signal peptidase n=1 Tax=Methanosarcina baikalica TaxID=3073890 RepID=UPI0037C7FB5F
MKVLVELLRAVTENGKLFRFQAPGFSMYPFIRNCDTIIISPLSFGRPRLGDVVAFIRPGTGKLVIHRVVENKGGCYLIKGDNTSEPDGLILNSNILGYVTKVERNGKKISLGLGLERLLIAYMSRKSILLPSLSLACYLIRPFLRRV